MKLQLLSNLLQEQNKWNTKTESEIATIYYGNKTKWNITSTPYWRRVKLYWWSNIVLPHSQSHCLRHINSKNKYLTRWLTRAFRLQVFILCQFHWLSLLKRWPSRAFPLQRSINKLVFRRGLMAIESKKYIFHNFPCLSFSLRNFCDNTNFIEWVLLSNLQNLTRDS